MRTPIEQLSALTIGYVESVSPDEIHVVLDIDAPQSVALNSGVPTGFPRVNSYVLIPNEGGAVVGLVVFLGVERSPFPRRTGLKDFGLLDLPFPLRRLHVTPIGTLRKQRQSSAKSSEHEYRLARGVAAFPTVGDPVLIPTPDQLRTIVEAGGPDRRVQIGTSTLAADAGVYVDPDKLFGRHLAVLGNTGSGKSCSVAGLVRWSLEAATKALSDPKKGLNARFIILDPNGEYLRTFADCSPPPRVLQVTPSQEGAQRLLVPAWMWNSSEWTAFAQASPRVQRPVLLEGLRSIRGGGTAESSIEFQLSRLFGGHRTLIQSMINQGPEAYEPYVKRKSVFQMVAHVITEATFFRDKAPKYEEQLGEVATTFQAVKDRRTETGRDGKQYEQVIGALDLHELVGSLDELLEALPVAAGRATTYSEDDPIKFELDLFPELLRSIATQQMSGSEQFIDTLVWRIRGLLSDLRLRAIIGDEHEITVVEWLRRLLSEGGTDSPPLTVVDLSLVPAEIIHICIAVVARVVFEAIQRYRRLTGVEVPTVLVLEEAHTFIHRGRSDDEGDLLTPAQMCRMTFEKIAREGRKFGLGLLLSSQRPYELSATVLAQCNTFLLHRLVNDQDQQLVARLVPDNVRGILRELPSLPAGQAILLGWAAAVPVLVEMRRLPIAQQPKSSDPDYWKVWTREIERPLDWEKVVDDWMPTTPEPKPEREND